MKKLLHLLALLILLPAVSYALYDDFSGYESYYEVIDNCVSLAPHSVSWVSDTTLTGAANLAIGTGATTVTSLQFDKNNLRSNVTINGNGIYPSASLNQRNITGMNDGYVTCLLSVPTITGSISPVSIELTSSAVITIGSKLTGSINITIDTATTGFTYLKSSAMSISGSAFDYSSIQSASIKITAPQLTTFFGAQISNIRVISNRNTTGGVWNEGSGIWEIFKVNSDTVYSQLESSGSNSSNPQLFTKSQYKDFVYSAKFKVVNDTNAYNDASLIFRYISGNYYKFVVTKSGSNAVLKIKKNNTDTSTLTITSTAVFDADTSGTVLTGNSFWLKAEVNGSNIKTYYATNTTPLTWVPGPIVSDLTNPVLSGYVGVCCDKKYIIDNVEVLPAPTSPNANGGDSVVKINWTVGYSYAGEIAGYNIYRSTTAGTYGATPYASTTGTSYNDTNVVNGNSYYYKITSVISTKTSTGTLTTDELPLAFAAELNANPHPGVKVLNNPFMPNSANSAANKIQFTVYNPSGAATELKVYQPTGVLVRTIPGADTIIYWDGTNNGGSIVEGGIYMWQITVDNTLAGSGTMVLAK
ncbi:MAG: hypothetical protein A2452_04665 [Candidatus Firestonebacteria bacterium RIFOXYC2_FULL_39_67]|nr:MAG: hypothetical protein A2536_11635 [Candidatus Firestonebacteria bacterium RIFOXYD2_FULL_39_29]OGF55879.1 MAG: hypothetical protein A2452_04665 [Candidatus Firestonebacteria bacterium RIFOXYC2_FULL_39_67]